MTKQDPKLKIVYRQVKDLIPYARNSRTHSEAQLSQIAGSIKEFGFTQPILLDGENGIIAGHGRWQAAFKLSMNEVPTIDLSHLTDSQKRAYIIADNKLALNSGWDEQLLELEIQDLRDAGFNIDLLAFDPSELKSVDVDYSVLDDEEIDDQLEDMEKGVRKAIQIEFELEHYDQANELVKWWREQGGYVGMMLINHLRNEKAKLSE
jgi:ParB-like chromosome segregation protein Spo0J